MGLLCNFLKNGSEPNTNDLFVHALLQSELCALFKDIKKIHTLHWDIYKMWLLSLISEKAAELCPPLTPRNT
jgi:hypothetical protein